MPDKKIKIAWFGKHFGEEPPLTEEEFETVCKKMDEIGFANGWFQELSSAPCLLPDFNKINPFDTVDSA